MSDIVKIILTSTLTITGGVIIFVFGQLISEAWLKPYFEYKKIVGEIDYIMIYWANIYSSPGAANQELSTNASQELRKIAASFSSKYTKLSNSWVLRSRRNVCSADDAKEIVKNLILISNSVHHQDSQNRIYNASEKVLELLRLK